MTIYLLSKDEKAVGPASLARKMGVSRVSAFQKMQRLAEKRVGDYVKNKGMIINDKGKKIAEKSIRKHHVLENFLQISLGMDSDKACEESQKLSYSVSDELVDKIWEKMGDKMECQCGGCLTPPYDMHDLYECHWCKKFLMEG